MATQAPAPILLDVTKQGVAFACLRVMKFRKDGEPWNNGKPAWNKGVAMKPPFACVCATCGSSMELRHHVTAERNRIYRIKRLGHPAYCSAECRATSANAKISATLMGHAPHPVTPEGNERRRAAMKGRTPWHAGKTMSEEWRVSRSRAWHSSAASRAHLARIQSEYSGERSPHWKGGLTPQNVLIRNSVETKAWRKAVFARDNYTCQACGKHGGTMHADHIKSFAEFPSLRFELDNGRTLCVACHRKTPNYGRPGRRSKKAIV